MVLKDSEGTAQSETHTNLKIMQNYVKEHFARMREEWEVNCIKSDAWHDREHLDAQIHERSEFATKRQNSKVQQYANSGEDRRRQNGKLGDITSEHEIGQAVAKLSNRESVGYDELTAEVFKVNREWLIPIIKTNFLICWKWVSGGSPVKDPALQRTCWRT